MLQGESLLQMHGASSHPSSGVERQVWLPGTGGAQPSLLWHLPPLLLWPQHRPRVPSAALPALAPPPHPLPRSRGTPTITIRGRWSRDSCKMEVMEMGLPMMMVR